MRVALVTVSVNPRLSVEIKDLVTKRRVNGNTGCLTSDVVAVTSARRRSAANGNINTLRTVRVI